MGCVSSKRGNVCAVFLTVRACCRAETSPAANQCNYPNIFLSLAGSSPLPAPPNPGETSHPHPCRDADPPCPPPFPTSTRRSSAGYSQALTGTTLVNKANFCKILVFGAQEEEQQQQKKRSISKKKGLCPLLHSQSSFIPCPTTPSQCTT